jgi:hypothetical protein
MSTHERLLLTRQKMYTDVYFFPPGGEYGNPG